MVIKRDIINATNNINALTIGFSINFFMILLCLLILNSYRYQNLD